jgi:hypothetical protein
MRRAHSNQHSCGPRSPVREAAAFFGTVFFNDRAGRCMAPGLATPGSRKLLTTSSAHPARRDNDISGSKALRPIGMTGMVIVPSGNRRAIFPEILSQSKERPHRDPASPAAAANRRHAAAFWRPGCVSGRLRRASQAASSTLSVPGCSHSAWCSSSDFCSQYR